MSGFRLEPEAYQFINAAKLTNNTHKKAIDYLCYNLKKYNLWNKMKAVYPFIGGTATTHKFNLINPQDSDSAFRLGFNGGLTHSATGILPNSTNSYGNTNINIQTNLTNNNIHFSYYSRTNINTLNAPRECGYQQDASGGYDMILAIQQVAGGNYTIGIIGGSYLINTNISIQNAISDTRGLFIVNRESSTSLKLIKNTTLLGANTTLNSTTLPNYQFYLFNIYQQSLGGVATNYSNRECAFSTIGDGLSDTDALNLYNIVQGYNTILSRQI